jgi:hypothetical protein
MLEALLNEERAKRLEAEAQLKGTGGRSAVAGNNLK